MSEETNRWDTPFGRWVKSVGVAKLRRALKERGVEVERSTIYGWVSGGPFPKPVTVDALVLSADGAISHADVYEHFRIIKPGSPGSVPNLAKAVSR